MINFIFDKCAGYFVLSDQQFTHGIIQLNKIHDDKKAQSYNTKKNWIFSVLCNCCPINSDAVEVCSPPGVHTTKRCPLRLGWMEA